VLRPYIMKGVRSALMRCSIDGSREVGGARRVTHCEQAFGLDVAIDVATVHSAVTISIHPRAVVPSTRQGMYCGKGVPLGWARVSVAIRSTRPVVVSQQWCAQRRRAVNRTRPQYGRPFTDHAAGRGGFDAFGQMAQALKVLVGDEHVLVDPSNPTPADGAAAYQEMVEEFRETFPNFTIKVRASFAPTLQRHSDHVLTHFQPNAISRTTRLLPAGRHRSGVQGSVRW
jgi:hypothetical protein